MPRVISRSEWGARPPRSITTNFSPHLGGVGLHYEGPQMGEFPHTSCATKVRGIQAFHMDGRGWSDIAYSALVCPHGDVYVGRWLGVRTAANGTNDANERFYAVCGLFGQGDPLTDAAKAGYLLAIDILRSEGRAGSLIKGHRQFKATACPGDPVQVWINAGCPAPAGSTPPQEDSLMFKVWYKDGDASQWLVLLAGGVPGLRWKIGTGAASQHYAEKGVRFEKQPAYILDAVRVASGTPLA